MPSKTATAPSEFSRECAAGQMDERRTGGCRLRLFGDCKENWKRESKKYEPHDNQIAPTIGDCISYCPVNYDRCRRRST